MSKNKQSSINWLVKKFAKYYAIHQLEEEIEQAKEMHKEESFKIFKAGQDRMEEGGKGFEQYYNETFNN